MELPAVPSWARRRAVAPGTTFGQVGVDHGVDHGVEQAGIPRTADEAVALLYGTHRHQLVRLATPLTRGASMAEELVPDAFVSLHRRWAAPSDPAPAPRYLRPPPV